MTLRRVTAAMMRVSRASQRTQCPYPVVGAGTDYQRTIIQSVNEYSDSNVTLFVTYRQNRSIWPDTMDVAIR